MPTFGAVAHVAFPLVIRAGKYVSLSGRNASDDRRLTVAFH